jgi:hypothetical protein
MAGVPQLLLGAKPVISGMCGYAHFWHRVGNECIIGSIDGKEYITNVCCQGRGGTLRPAALGAGQQIPVTHFHTYNHATVITSRIPF